MFTKEYVQEVLNQMCAPYMATPLSDEYVQKIYDEFVKIRNGEAVEQSVQADEGDSSGDEEFTNPYLLSGEELDRAIALRR